MISYKGLETALKEKGISRQTTWIVWPIAGVVFAAYKEIFFLKKCWY